MTQPTSPFELWNPQSPLPSHEHMNEPRVLTHVQITRAKQGEYHYLHEPAIAWNRGKLHVCFANHPLAENNTADELIRGCVSTDGLSFTPPSPWFAPPLSGACAFNHPVLAARDGVLWAFVTRWETGNDMPRMDTYQQDDHGQWHRHGQGLDTFIPFHPPTRLPSGGWIMGGESGWLIPAVALCDSDDWSRWRLVIIPTPADMEMQFPETAILVQRDRLLAICRPKLSGPATISVSSDEGKTWSVMTLSNLPIATSQPSAGTLSTGQHFLIANHVHEKRTMLTIAVTASGGQTLQRVWKIRHQAHPLIRLWGGHLWKDGHPDPEKSMVGKPTQWAYPAAAEHDGRLYIVYSQGKEDCSMSIIPIDALAVDA